MLHERNNNTVRMKVMFANASSLTSFFQCGCAHMYGRFSSSFALLISVVVIGISAACGMCILFIQNLTYYLTTVFIFIFIHHTTGRNRKKENKISSHNKLN